VVVFWGGGPRGGWAGAHTPFKYLLNFYGTRHLVGCLMNVCVAT